MRYTLSDIIIAITPVHRNLHTHVSAARSQPASHVRAGGARIIATEKMQSPQKRATRSGSARGPERRPPQANERNLIGSFFYFASTFLSPSPPAPPSPPSVLRAFHPRCAPPLNCNLVSRIFGADNIAWLRPVRRRALIFASPILRDLRCGALRQFSRNPRNKTRRSTRDSKNNLRIVFQLSICQAFYSKSYFICKVLLNFYFLRYLVSFGIFFAFFLLLFLQSGFYTQCQSQCHVIFHISYLFLCAQCCTEAIWLRITRFSSKGIDYFVHLRNEA